MSFWFVGRVGGYDAYSHSWLCRLERSQQSGSSGQGIAPLSATLPAFLEKILPSRKINGVDCGPHCFAYVGDIADPKTWKLCIHVPGDAAKTVNAIKSSLGRFDDAVTGIPVAQRRQVFYKLVGALQAHGMTMKQNKVFEVTTEEQTLILAELHARKFLESIEWEQK
jgi:hypothetical protein